jgi:hypothetical protein
MQERGSIVGTRKGMAVDISGMLHGLCLYAYDHLMLPYRRLYFCVLGWAGNVARVLRKA